MGLFKKIGQALKKTKDAITRKLDELLSHGELNDEFFDDLTDILISSDVGVNSSMEIVDELRDVCHKKKIRFQSHRLRMKKIITTFSSHHFN